MSTSKNKIAGAVYGFAIGDAMGATTEFMTAEQIQKSGKVSNIIGGGWLNLEPGEVTDDTQMSMCVMDAIMNSTAYGFDTYLADKFSKWLNGGPKDVGGQCAKGIRHYQTTGEPIAEYDDQALGNGSLMRAMPCALMGPEYNSFNELQGRLTHNNQECSQIILEYSRLIQDYLANKIYTYNAKGLLGPSGYIRNTFNNSIYWSGLNSFEEAILGAVNHGGDADTIAAITGSLAGAKFGYDSIPERWINQLKPGVKNKLNIFINFVFAYVQNNNKVV